MNGSLEMMIDGIVLHDVAPHQRGAVRSAILAELHRLMAASHTDLRSIGSARLANADVQVSPGASPQAIGTAVARAIHRSITGGRR